VLGVGLGYALASTGKDDYLLVKEQSTCFDSAPLVDPTITDSDVSCNGPGSSIVTIIWEKTMHLCKFSNCYLEPLSLPVYLWVLSSRKGEIHYDTTILRRSSSFFFFRPVSTTAGPRMQFDSLQVAMTLGAFVGNRSAQHL